MEMLKDIRNSLASSGNIIAKIGAFFFGLAILFMLLGKTVTYIFIGIIAIVSFGKIRLNRKNCVEAKYREI